MAEEDVADRRADQRRDLGPGPHRARQARRAVHRHLVPGAARIQAAPGQHRIVEPERVGRRVQDLARSDPTHFRGRIAHRVVPADAVDLSGQVERGRPLGRLGRADDHDLGRRLG